MPYFVQEVIVKNNSWNKKNKISGWDQQVVWCYTTEIASAISIQIFSIQFLQTQQEFWLLRTEKDLQN